MTKREKSEQRSEQENKKDIEVAIEKFKKLAKSKRYIDSFFIHGSRVIGCHTEYSDLDVAFVLTDKDSISLLKQEIFSFLSFDPNMKNFFKDEGFDYWYLNSLEIGIHIFTVEEFKNKIDTLYFSVEQYEKLSAWAQHIVIESKPEVVKSNILSLAFEKAKKIPTEFRSVLVNTYLSRTEKRLQWFEKRPYWKSPFEELFDLTLILEDLIRCQYAINNMHYMPGLKQYFFDAKEMNPDITQELVAFMKLDPQPIGRLKIEKKILLISMYQKLQQSYK